MSVLISGITVAYEEMENSPVESMEQGSFKAIRQLKCRWGDRHELMHQLLGGVESSGVRRRPDTYPGHAGVHALRCKVKPLGGLSTPSTDLRHCDYQDAMLEVEYESTDWEWSDAGPRFQERLIPFSETLALPSAGLIWASDDERVRVLKPELTEISYLYELSFFHVTQIPPAWSSLVGKVNADIVHALRLGNSFQPGQLLFEAPDFKQKQRVGETLLWDVRFRMRFRLEQKADWNMFRRFEQWDEVKRVGETESLELYEKADFMPVLRFFGA